MKTCAVFCALCVVGCGYQFSPKEMTLVNAKGETTTECSFGSYIRVSSIGWEKGTFKVSFIDADGLAHNLYGVTGVGVGDIPITVDAPMWHSVTTTIRGCDIATTPMDHLAMK